jgi:phage shock protein C
MEGGYFMEQKRLYRTNSNKMICGVCGGLAEYINIDPTVVRLLWVVFALAGGFGVLAYIIAAIIMPVKA